MNIAPHLARGCVRFIEGDVCDPDAMERAMRGAEVVIHMACVRASINYPHSCMM